MRNQLYNGPGSRWQIRIVNFMLLLCLFLAAPRDGKTSAYVQHSTYTAWHLVKKSPVQRVLLDKSQAAHLNSTRAANLASLYKYFLLGYNKLIKVDLLAARKTFYKLFPSLILAQRQTIPGNAKDYAVQVF